VVIIELEASAVCTASDHSLPRPAGVPAFRL